MEFRVPATSANLGPGFDSFRLALGLYNRFSLKPSKIISIQIYGEGSKNPKLRVDNMFVRIFNAHLKNSLVAPFLLNLYLIMQFLFLEDLEVVQQ